MLKGPLEPAGMPLAEVLATGRAVVVREVDIERYPNPRFGRYMALGIKSACLVPLNGREGTIGTLDLGRMTDDAWTPDDLAFLVQVANQIALALENALAYRELAELKDRLATEKLYLEDEDPHRPQHRPHGGGRAGLSIRPEKHSNRGAHRLDRSHNGRNRYGKGTRRPGHSRIERP
jgi:GAF domain-containing protein